MSNRIIKFFFCIYIFLLPHHSFPHLYDFFRSWSLNFALLPLFFLVALIIFHQIILRRELIFFNGNQLGVIKNFLYFNFYSVFITITASFLLLNSEVISSEFYRGPEMNSIKEILRAVIVLFSFTVMVILLRNISDLQVFIKAFYLSIVFTIIYGYFQIYSIVFCGLGGKLCTSDVIQTTLEFISPILDQGWQNERRITPYPNSFLRINLLTPEANTAGALLLIYFLPILLASIISRFSLIKLRLLGISCEAILLILLMPILLFTLSSAAFFSFFFLFAVFYFFSFLRANKNLFIINTILLVGFFGLMLIVLNGLGLIDYAAYFILKVFDLSVGSTSVRFSLFIASINLFTAFPMGVGMGNHETMLVDYLPFWSSGNYEILRGIYAQNLPTLNYWLTILTANGFIGFILFILFLRSIWKNTFVRLTYDLSGFSNFRFLSYIFFLIAFIFISLSSSHGTFLWLWSIFGFYAALGNINFSKNK